MSWLPSIPGVGVLRDFEVYDFCDEPLLYAAVNETGQIHIVLQTAAAADGTRSWCIVPVSSSRFAELRTGRRDVQSAFIHPETGQYLTVDVRGTQLVRAEWQPATSIDTASLPPRGEMLVQPIADSSDPAPTDLQSALRQLDEAMASVRRALQTQHS